MEQLPCNFEALHRKALRVLAEAQFELSRANDMYRLHKILTDINYEVGEIADHTYDLVQEIEHGN
jgi:hypothetical protein